MERLTPEQGLQLFDLDFLDLAERADAERRRRFPANTVTFVRDRIINALLDYKHPDTGDRPVLLAVRKEDAHVFGMGGAQAGDVVYVLKPEYMAEHGYGLPTGESGCGSLKNLLMFRGPNIRKGYRYTRPRWLADIVPTFCYITGNPVPADAEGAPIYQIMENPNLVD